MKRRGRWGRWLTRRGRRRRRRRRRGVAVDSFDSARREAAGVKACVSAQSSEDGRERDGVKVAWGGRGIDLHDGDVVGA